MPLIFLSTITKRIPKTNFLGTKERQSGNLSSASELIVAEVRLMIGVFTTQEFKFPTRLPWFPRSVRNQIRPASAYRLFSAFPYD